MDRTRITVLDFSGIFARERRYFPAELEDRIRWDIMDFRTLDGTMCFCADESVREIRRRLRTEFQAASASGRPGRLPEVCVAEMPEGIHWIDTGDYHYLTYFFLEGIPEPFTLVLLDHHPDDQPSVFGSDVLSCGGWVQTAMERLPLLSRIVSIGPGGAVTVREKTAGEWRVVRQAGMESATEVLRETIAEGNPFYLSIDKDVLSKDFARTDWSQGEMGLLEMLQLLEVLAPGKVLGADLCGGLSEAKGAEAADFEINAKTDSILINKLLDIIN